MNYLKHYIKLIRKAQQSTYECYSENHHVFPTSIFGKNNKLKEQTNGTE